MQETNIYFILDKSHAEYNTAITTCGDKFAEMYPDNILSIVERPDDLFSEVKVRHTVPECAQLRNALNQISGLVVISHFKENHPLIRAELAKPEWQWPEEELP
jgi:hypothetical protein